jgi:hypothetical protein
MAHPPAAVGNASCRSLVGRHGAGGVLSVARVGQAKATPEGKVEKARCVRSFGEERCNCSINN